MKSSIAATSRWTKGRFSNFFSSPADNSDVGASSTDQSSAQGEELHHRKHCEEENDGKRSKKSHVSTSTMQYKIGGMNTNMMMKMKMKIMVGLSSNQSMMKTIHR